MKWRCRYRGSTTGETWESDNDNSQWASNIVCDPLINLPKMNYVPASQANYGDSPSGPNAPVIQPVTDQEPLPDLFDFFGQPTVTRLANAKAKSSKAAVGCCPEEPNCFKCWLKRYRGWLLIAALAAVALWVKLRKP